jgi:hypothetical protein
MSSLTDYIKGNMGTEELVIQQKLNSLFYLPMKPELETKMILAQAKQDRVRAGLHLSAILTSEEEFCYREQVLSLFYHMAQGENIDIGLKRIFEQGNFIGEKWQRLFLRGGLGGVEDMDMSQFNPKYDLSFTPDAILTIGKKKYICEIKSQNAFLYEKSKGHSSGEKQCRMYMYLTGIDRGFVLVDNKNDQNFKIIMLHHDEELILPYIERLEQIQKYKHTFLTKKKPPKRICDSPTCKRATRCNMLEACFNIGEGRKRLKRD